MATSTGPAFVSMAAALVATWPLVGSVANAVPLGTQRVATVPLFEIWELWWNADRASHLYDGFWDAPIFHPIQGSFTFSEPQILIGLAVSPLWWLDAPPALIYNVALLTFLSLNGIFAYRLSRALGATVTAALCASVLMITAPFFAKIIGVLNLVPVFGVLWTLEGLVRFGKGGGLAAAGWFAAGMVTTYLTCQQYALMFAIFIPGGVAVALAMRQYSARSILELAFATVLGALSIAALALPTLQVHQGMGLRRSESIVAALSADASAFLTRPGTAWLQWPPTSWDDTGGLFPGMMLFGLATIGAAAAWRDRAVYRWVRLITAMAVVSALLATGTNLMVFGWQPFDTLRALVPAFDELRSPFRFAALLDTTLPVLAAMAVTKVNAFLRPRGYAVGAVIVIGLLAAGENRTVATPLVNVPEEPAAGWVSWLAAQPADSVVVHLPFPSGLHVSDYELETRRMYWQTRHGKRMVNGYSSFFPPGYLQFQLDLARSFPSHEQVCFLRDALHVDFVVFDADWLRRWEEAAATEPLFARVYADTHAVVFTLNPGLCGPGSA